MKTDESKDDRHVCDGPSALTAPKVTEPIGSVDPREFKVNDLQLPMSGPFGTYLQQIGPKPELMLSCYYALLCAEMAVLLGTAYISKFALSGIVPRRGQLDTNPLSEHAKPQIEAVGRWWSVIRASWQHTVSKLQQGRQSAFQLHPSKYDRAALSTTVGALKAGEPNYYLALKATAHETAFEFFNRIRMACERGDEVNWMRPQDVPILQIEDLSTLRNEIIAEVRNAPAPAEDKAQVKTVDGPPGKGTEEERHSIRLELVAGGFALNGEVHNLTGKPRDMLATLLSATHCRCTAADLSKEIVDAEAVTYPEQVIKDTAKMLRAALKTAFEAAGVQCENPLQSVGKGKDLSYILSRSANDTPPAKR